MQEKWRLFEKNTSLLCFRTHREVKRKYFSFLYKQLLFFCGCVCVHCSREYTEEENFRGNSFSHRLFIFFFDVVSMKNYILDDEGNFFFALFCLFSIKTQNWNGLEDSLWTLESDFLENFDVLWCDGKCT